MDTNFQFQVYTGFKEEYRDKLYYLGLLFMVGWISFFTISIISSYFSNSSNRYYGYTAFYLIFAQLIVIIIQKYSIRKFKGEYYGNISIQNSSLYLNEKCIPIENIKLFDINISTYSKKELNCFTSYLDRAFFFDVDIIKANKSNGINGNVIRILTQDDIHYEFNFLIDSKKDWDDFKTKIISLFFLNLINEEKAYKLLNDHYGFTHSDFYSLIFSFQKSS